MKLDDVKVWLFFLVNERTPYAFTVNKEYKSRFLQERNSDCFNVRKIEMDELEFSMFVNIHRSIMLSEMPLNTSLTEYVNILMTPREYARLHLEASNMDSEIERIQKDFSKLKLKSKYSDSINYLSTVECMKIEENGEKCSLSTINLLFLFRILFKNTFERSDDEP